MENAARNRFAALFPPLRRALILLATAAAWAPGFAAAKDAPAARAFSAVKTPDKTAAAPIGFYAKGCLAGAKPMAQAAAHWQMLHPSRNRYWGHPDMIAVLQNLAAAAAKQGWSGLLIGDISQPRGGPLPFGHSSHQIGLDADIWFAPKPARGLSPQELENINTGSVLAGKTKALDPKKWSKAHTALLRLAAENSKTERIFVNPAIKKYLCSHLEGDKSWLNKLRPYWGHEEHFHLRLKCPGNAKDCEAQAPPPKGSGCDASLDWWFTKAAQKPKKPAAAWNLKNKLKARRPLMVSDLPKPCAALLP